MEKDQQEKEIDESTAEVEKQDKDESFTKEDTDERKGIIPEDMDFKKFLGCGG